MAVLNRLAGSPLSETNPDAALMLRGESTTAPKATESRKRGRMLLIEGPPQSILPLSVLLRAKPIARARGKNLPLP